MELRVTADNTPRVIERHKSLFVVDKPPGMPVHPTGQGADVSLTAWIQHSFHVDVSPIHRIDRATSGLVLLSSNSNERAFWGRLFSTGAVHKEYLAVVHGRPPGQGTITVPLYDRRRRKTLEAITHYETEACFYDTSIIRCSPSTGRKHQIRKHLSLVGHPILGDSRYARPNITSNPNGTHISNVENMVHPNGKARMWLHAHTLATEDALFTTGNPHEFEMLHRLLSERDNTLEI